MMLKNQVGALSEIINSQESIGWYKFKYVQMAEQLDEFEGLVSKLMDRLN